MSALGALFGGGGAQGAPGMGGGDPGGGDPDALLSQIVDLMNQYLALGQDTPAFQPVSEALPAIQEAAGGAPMGADSEGPQDMGSEPGGEPPAEGAPMDNMQPSSAPTSFGDASSQALDALKKRKGQGSY